MAKDKEKDKKSAELEAAELRKAIAEAKKAELEVKELQQDIDHDAARRKRDEWELKVEDATSEYHRRVLYFNAIVNGNTAKSLRLTLESWHDLYPDQPYTIYINSGGGSVFDGFDIFDQIRKASRQGHHVTTVVAGMAASMAGVILQAGDTRIIGRNSYLHLHEVSTMAIGNASEIKDVATLSERLTVHAATIYANRSSGKSSAEDVRRMMERKDVWLSAEEALEKGFVDAIND